MVGLLFIEYYQTASCTDIKQDKRIWKTGKFLRVSICILLKGTVQFWLSSEVREATVHIDKDSQCSNQVLNSVSATHKLWILNKPAWCIGALWQYLLYIKLLLLQLVLFAILCRLNWQEENWKLKKKKYERCVFQHLDVGKGGVKCVGFVAFKNCKFIDWKYVC